MILETCGAIRKALRKTNNKFLEEKKGFYDRISRFFSHSLANIAHNHGSRSDAEITGH